MALLSSKGIASPTCAEKPRMAPGEELPGEILRDGVAFDETGQQALPEQLHHRVSVPRLDRVKRPVVRERSVRHEKVTMWMPLEQVAAGRDGDDGAGPSVRSELSLHVLGEGLGGALREVEQKLSPLSEDPAEEAQHGDNDVSMRDGRKHFLLQPLGPQELLLFLARRAEVSSAARERAQHADPARRAPKSREAM